MFNNDLSVRMKSYEEPFTRFKLFPFLPVIIRVDGICFHKFCQDLKKPYDEQLSSLMIEVTESLVKEFVFDVAYTQSDEITFCWKNNNPQSQLYADGKIQKLSSHLASKTSVKFNKLLEYYLPNKFKCFPVFDARAFNVPNLEEAANNFLWRELDATRNSVQSAARTYFSHNQVKNKNCSELQEMLFSQKGINWNNYPNFFKRGTYIIKVKRLKSYSKKELEVLPEKHLAKSNPELKIERTEYIKCDDLPKFISIEQRKDFLFGVNTLGYL